LWWTGGDRRRRIDFNTGRRDMRGWIRAAVLAALLGAAVGACARAGDIAAPDGTTVRMDGADDPMPTGADSTGGRWGGYIGGGG
jgi:heme A synthase